MTIALCATIHFTLIITIGDGWGSIRYKRKEQRKARRNGDDRWEMAQGRRRGGEGALRDITKRDSRARRSTEE